MSEVYTVPIFVYESELDVLKSICKRNGIKLDDWCAATSNGSVYALWIRKELIDTEWNSFDKKVGSFIC